MKVAEQVSVTITSGEHSGKTLLLDVEDFQPLEPSAYCWTPGWNCAVQIQGKTVWFFVDEAGVVWHSPNQDEDGYSTELPQSVGICPAQEVEFEKRYGAEVN